LSDKLQERTRRKEIAIQFLANGASRVRRVCFERRIRRGAGRQYRSGSEKKNPYVLRDAHESKKKRKDLGKERNGQAMEEWAKGARSTTVRQWKTGKRTSGGGRIESGRGKVNVKQRDGEGREGLRRGVRMERKRKVDGGGSWRGGGWAGGGGGGGGRGGAGGWRQEQLLDDGRLEGRYAQASPRGRKEPTGLKGKKKEKERRGEKTDPSKLTTKTGDGRG